MLFSLRRLDHAVSNVPKLFEAVDYLCGVTGFHEFSEFTAEDVGTLDSGLNSMVLANNSEFILLPVNEPTFGTRRKSQIQTFLEANNGAGIQHLALLTDDVYATVAEMRKRTQVGGFDFMPAPGPEYYAKVEQRLGKGVVSPEDLARLEKLGLLIDKDDQVRATAFLLVVVVVYHDTYRSCRLLVVLYIGSAAAGVHSARG